MHAYAFLKIERDEYAGNPRQEFDHSCTMALYHRHYISLGDKSPGYDAEAFDSWDAMERAIETDGNLCLPVYMYDHSGITIRTSPFSCLWDSGQIGYIYMPKKTAIENWGSKPDAKICTKKIKEAAYACMVAEVEEYGQYLAGDVWGVVIEDEDGNTIESCWGFYGREYAEEEGERMLAYWLDQAEIEAKAEAEAGAQTERDRIDAVYGEQQELFSLMAA